MIDYLFQKHGVDMSDAPSGDLEYVCPNCATFYSKYSASRSELVLDDNTFSGVREILYCDCHGVEKQIDMAVEIHCNTPLMDWQQAHLEVISENLEDELRDVERELGCFYN